MERQLELAAFGVALAGWLCSILTRCLALWKVSGTLDNSTATLPAYWDGVWLEWDHWDLAHDGSLHCSFYQSLLSLSGSFRTWRALIMAAIGAGAFAAVIGALGLLLVPRRGQIKVFSGSAFVLSGILMLVPIAWTCHHTSQPLEGAVLLRRDWGPALYLGWISFALMVAGGAFLTTRCPTAESRAEQPENSRTGRRTYLGLLMDGWNSMIRYYKNNFSDGFRQDSIDLFLGNYAVDEADWVTPLHDLKDWKFLTLPIIMVVAFSMCIICLLMAGDTWTETLAYILFWGTASIVTGGLILFNGRDFVDAPRLVQKEKLD